MAVAGDGGKTFTKEYLEDGIARLEEENKIIPTPENETAIELARKALEKIGE